MAKFSIFLSLLISTIAYGGITEWRLSGSGNWDDPINWTNGVPTAVDSAIIDISSVNLNVTINKDARALYVYLGNDNAIVISAEGLTIADSPGDALVIDGLLINQGYLTITNPQDEGILVNNSLQNYGSMDISLVKNFPYIGLIISDSGSMDNFGNLTLVECRVGLQIFGFYFSYDNSDLYLKDCGISLNGGTCNLVDSTTVNGGGLSFENASQLIIDPDGILILSNGIGLGFGSTIENAGILEIIDGAIYISFGSSLKLLNGSMTKLNSNAGDKLNMDPFTEPILDVESGALFEIN